MPPAFFVDDGGGQVTGQRNIVFGVRCRNDDFFIGTGTVTGRRGGLLQVVGASVQTLDIELTMFVREHLIASIHSKVRGSKCRQ